MLCIRSVVWLAVLVASASTDLTASQLNALLTAEHELECQLVLQPAIAVQPSIQPAIAVHVHIFAVCGHK